ncbi:WXG100 family type VII secretion target [Streptomyces sp. NPDC052496]|uniref:WXG100 family type VII secretion target n=1 Tax=Streptomyces sp. NPDC052496 TaxID=3154951 RepID=UPI0034233E19
MAANPYPHLGWNPVPGIPSEVTALQQKVTRAATALRSCHQQIQQLIGESSYWQGDAAKAFREALDGELPTYIKNAARSLEKASAQLKVWDGDLTSHRDLARKYDDEAGERKAAADRAAAHRSQAAQHPDLKLAGQQFPSQAEADAAEQRLRAAERSLNEATTALNNANSSYNDVISKAERLETTHADQAETVAKELDGATDKLAPKEPGWLSKAVNAIWDGIKAVGAFLYEHAGTIGAIAGLLALFPTPLTPLFAGIAVVASAASMTKNLSDPEFRAALAGEKGGWDTFAAYASLAGDTVGMIPGVGALGRAGKEVFEASVTAERWGVAVSRSEQVSGFAKEIVPAFSGKATAAAEEGAAAFSAGGREAAKRVTEIGANGVNVTANLASSAESLGWLPKEGAGHNAAESTKAAATLHGIAGLVGIA